MLDINIKIKDMHGMVLPDTARSKELLNNIFDEVNALNEMFVFNFTCPGCDKDSNRFYRDILFLDGVIPLCKKCYKKKRVSRRGAGVV